MKIQETLTYLLIIGSLSSTTAHNQIQLPTKEELAAWIPALLNVPGFDTFDIDEFEAKFINQFQDYCEINGESKAFEIVNKSSEYFRGCASSVFDLTMFGQEIEAAIPQGGLDTVLKKYCDRVPRFKECGRHYNDAMDLCLDPEQKKKVINIRNNINELLDFACDNEGDRIGIFIAAGGVECIREKQPEIIVCAHQTIGRNSTPATNTTLSMVIDVEYCMQAKNFNDCVVSVLESCPDQMAANVMNSLYNYVKKKSPCESLLNEHGTANTGNGGATQSIVNLLLINTFAMLIIKSVRFA